MKSSKICVFFDTDTVQKVPFQSHLENFALRVLKKEGKHGDVNLVFINDFRMRELNLEYRKLDKTTDVLSFEWNDDELLGELYVSVDQVAKQAPEYNATYYMELKRVILHGVLHLCGYDHIGSADRKVMRKKEEAYLSRKIY